MVGIPAVENSIHQLIADALATPVLRPVVQFVGVFGQVEELGFEAVVVVEFPIAGSDHAVLDAARAGVDVCAAEICGDAGADG